MSKLQSHYVLPVGVRHIIPKPRRSVFSLRLHVIITHIFVLLVVIITVAGLDPHESRAVVGNLPDLDFGELAKWSRRGREKTSITRCKMEIKGNQNSHPTIHTPPLCVGTDRS